MTSYTRDKLLTSRVVPIDTIYFAASASQWQCGSPERMKGIAERVGSISERFGGSAEKGRGRAQTKSGTPMLIDGFAVSDNVTQNLFAPSYQKEAPSIIKYTDRFLKSEWSSRIQPFALIIELRANGKAMEGRSPRHYSNPLRRKVRTMARMKKQNSSALELAATRAAGLKSIEPALDLGNGLTLVAYSAAVEDGKAKLANYNTLLSQVDEAQNAFESAERNLADLSDRMLAGVAARYGRDSDQYEMAGGTKKSDRRRSATNKTSAVAKA